MDVSGLWILFIILDPPVGLAHYSTTSSVIAPIHKAWRALCALRCPEFKERASSLIKLEASAALRKSVSGKGPMGEERRAMAGRRTSRGKFVFR
jgi:hypothetical protein